MSTSLFDLSGKIAPVTGATHGLGMAMVIGETQTIYKEQQFSYPQSLICLI